MKDHKDVVSFLKEVASRVDNMDKTAEENVETTTPVEGQGEVGQGLADTAAESAGKREPGVQTDTEPSANKPGSPKKGDGDAPADIDTSGPMEASPELKEAARKSLNMDKLGEACAVAFDLLDQDMQDKEAARQEMEEMNSWMEKGAAYRSVLLEEFDKMAESINEVQPGFKKQYELWGGGEALLMKLAEVMPTAIVPEELEDEAAAYEDAMGQEADMAALDEIGVTPEDIAAAEQTIEALKAEGVPEEAIVEALAEAAQEELAMGEGAADEMPAEDVVEEAAPVEEPAVPAEPAVEETPAEMSDEDKEAELVQSWSALKQAIRKQLKM